MELHVVGRGFKCTEDVREYVEKRISPLLRKYLNHKESVVAHVRLGDTNGPKGGADKEVSVDIRFPKKHRIHLKDRGQHLFEAIDIVAKELENVLQRDKDKWTGNTRHPKKQYLAKVANEAE